jgi:hypothetical protein
MSKNKPTKTTETTNEPTELPKRKYEGKLTLAPLDFDEALAGLLATPPPPKEVKPKTETAKKHGKDKEDKG